MVRATGCNTRFARFINVPELMQMFRQAADVQTAQMLNLPRPTLENDKPAISQRPGDAGIEADSFRSWPPVRSV